MSISSAPLPYGWISQVDPNTNHPFFVDTKATPPRSIWVHPYEDEQYLKEHPDVREKVGHNKPHDDQKQPVDDHSKRESYNGQSSEKTGDDNQKSSKAKQRGFLGKLKDKAIGTKEEREAAKRDAILQKQRQEEERMWRIQMQQQAFAQQQAQHAQGQYGAPSPYGYGNPYGQQMGMAGGSGFGGGRRGGGMALPLIGGLAGGLLLGEMLGGDFGGGDFGGGDFGGGDFGGF